MPRQKQEIRSAASAFVTPAIIFVFVSLLLHHVADATSDQVSRLFAQLGPRRESAGADAAIAAPTLVAAHESMALPSTDFHLVDPADEQLKSSEAHRGPPVYKSAPKQIIEVQKSAPSPLTTMKKASQPKPKQAPAREVKQPPPPPPQVKRASTGGSGSGPNDLSSAAAGHKHHHHQGHGHVKKKKRKKHNYPSHYTYYGKYHE